MNAVERLLKLDAKLITERETKEIEVKRLSKKMGEPFYITIGAIDGNRFAELTSSALTKKGEVDYGKAYNANALIVVEGVIEPNLKDTALLSHYGASTPKELAIKLFGGEIGAISGEIAVVSGMGGDEDAEIKN